MANLPYDPLVDACKRGKVDAIKFLLSCPVATERSLPAALIAAVRFGSEVCIEILIDHGVDVNEEYNLETALLVSCETKQFEIAVKLLNHGAVVTNGVAGDIRRRILTKVIEAVCSLKHENKIAKEGSPKIVVTTPVVKVLEALSLSGDLARCGAEVDIVTLCRRLFEFRSFDLAKTIVRSQRDSKEFQEFSFALYYAAKNNWPELVGLLLDQGIWIDGDNSTGAGRTDDSPLVGACESGHANIVSILISRGARLDEESRTGFDHIPLVVAASNGKRDVVQLLINAGADVNEAHNYINLWDRPYSALHAATVGGHADVVEQLLTSGANVAISDDRGYAPIHIAAERAFDTIVQVLIDAGADTNALTKHHETPLNLICVGIAEVNRPIGRVDRRIVGNDESFVATVNLLLSHGANVNIQNDAGNSPLCNACVSNSRDIAKILLDSGANVNHKTKSGCPLWTACHKSNVDLVQLLLDRGADPNPTTWERSNQPFQRLVPLCIAAAANNTKMIEVLIAAGASISNGDGMHKTALHYAVVAHKVVFATETVRLAQIIPMVILLLERGADVNAFDARGETPLAIAVAGLRARNLRLYSNTLEEGYFMQYNVRMDVATYRRLILPVVLSFVHTQIDVIRLLVSSGAILDDEHCPTDKSTLSLTASPLSSLCQFVTCTPIDIVLVEILLNSHASFKWLTWVLDRSNSLATTSLNLSRLARRGSSLQLCNVILMAGYGPFHAPKVESAEEKEKECKKSTEQRMLETALAIRVKRYNEEVPSLMRICRHNIRRHLSVRNRHRSIASDLNELHLSDELEIPDELFGYLCFDGPLSETSIVLPDLSDEMAMLDLLRIQA